MKTLISFCLFVFIFFVGQNRLFSQNENLKHDYIWLTGYASTVGQPEFGGTVLDFHEDTLTTYYEFRDIDFDFSNTTMCNEQGELVFYTNNRVIANSSNQIMINGNNLNFDDSNTIPQDRGIQAVVALPSPTLNDSTYFLFHQELTSVPENINNTPFACFNLLYSIIDMSCCGENPLGQVIEKNIPLITNDTLSYGKITATRHANGKDWWLIMPQYSTKIFYKILISEEGFEIIQQEIPELAYQYDGVGQAVFSPDGTKYIRMSANTFFEPCYLDIIDFDRCSGEFYNPTRIQLEDTQSGFGLAISPNSRFLYSSYNAKFYQYDLQSSNYDSILIDEYDGFVSPFPTPPFLAQLGPDSKIYFTTYNGTNVLHVVHNPDELGLACNLEQHGVQLPTYNIGTIPNHPNYRLGRLIGSPCDTLEWLPDDTTSIVANSITIENFSVSPNPTASSIHFSAEKKSDYIITDWLGREIRFGVTTFGDNQVDVSDLVSGVYFISLKGDVPKVAKFVVQR